MLQAQRMANFMEIDLKALARVFIHEDVASDFRPVGEECKTGGLLLFDADRKVMDAKNQIGRLRRDRNKHKGRHRRPFCKGRSGDIFFSICQLAKTVAESSVLDITMMIRKAFGKAISDHLAQLAKPIHPKPIRGDRGEIRDFNHNTCSLNQVGTRGENAPC